MIEQLKAIMRIVDQWADMIKLNAKCIKSLEGIVLRQENRIDLLEERVRDLQQQLLSQSMR